MYYNECILNCTGLVLTKAIFCPRMNIFDKLGYSKSDYSVEKGQLFNVIKYPSNLCSTNWLDFFFLQQSSTNILK